MGILKQLGFDKAQVSLLFRMFKLVSGFKTHLIWAVFFMIAFGLFNVAPAVYIKNIVDSLSSGDVPPIQKFFLVGCAIILLFFLKGISFFGQNYLMNSLGQRLIKELRDRLFSKVVSLPFSFFNKRQTGDLISRFTVDLTVLQNALNVAITGPLRDFPQVLFLLSLMLYRSWQLFLVTMLLIPVAAMLISKFGRQNKKITTKRQSKFGELTSLLSETITGIRVVKAFNMENYEIKRFNEENNRLYKYFLKSIKIGSYSYPVLELVGATCGAIILTYGGYLIIHNHMTGGDFASYLISFFMLNDPMKKFNGLSLKLQEGLSAVKRVYDVLDADNPITDKENAALLPPIKKGIEIDVQAFAYDEKVVLNNVQFTIEAGTVAALVGSSGSGKSTLANLIPRFFDIPKENGSIKIDGHDLRDVSVRSLRDQIAIVTQDTILFDDTVANNISYGDINCPKEKIEEAARFAYAHDFIQNLPDGYDQQVGEKGVMLSGGQKQRLSIARALIKNAPILILDEATSALDSESEKEVQGAIENLMKNRTTLVIAHRLSTVQNADVIYVMNDGRVIESGSHQELLEQKGEYSRLYEIQFSD